MMVQTSSADMATILIFETNRVGIAVKHSVQGETHTIKANTPCLNSNAWFKHKCDQLGLETKEE